MTVRAVTAALWGESTIEEVHVVGTGVVHKSRQRPDALVVANAIQRTVTEMAEARRRDSNPRRRNRSNPVFLLQKRTDSGFYCLSSTQ